MKKLLLIMIIVLACCSCGADKPDKVEINIVEGEWRHSHNDYRAEYTIYDALEAGCQILEYDIIYAHGAVYVTHDNEFYDSPLTYFGELTEYLEEIEEVVTEYRIKLYVYLEVKSRHSLKEPLYKVLSAHTHESIQYLPEDWNSEFAVDFIDSYGDELNLVQYRDFAQGKNIIDLDVY